MPSTKAVKPNEVWLCLRFTHLALNALGHAYHDEKKRTPNKEEKEEKEEKRALVITYQNTIWQCNAAANNNGLEAGMSVNHALILAPDLLLLERDIQTEKNKIKELQFWAYRFTSLVSSYNSNTLLLEVGKSSKLFNGLLHLINLISNDLNSFNITASIGLGLSPKAAYVLSYNTSNTLWKKNNYSEKLNAANLDTLDLDKKVIQKLLNCGFNKLNDLTNIPKPELGSRFGKDTLLYLEQLWGEVADPQIGITPPKTFYASVDFAEPIRNIAWIQQQLERLLKDLTHFITTQQLVCRSFTWRFFKNGGKQNNLLKTITIGVSAKQNIGKVFKELTDLKLESTKLDWEFSSIELSCTQLYPIQLYNDDLFDPKPSKEQFNQLIDKLSNRLGHTALFRVNPENEHLPELANGRRDATPAVREHAARYNSASDSNSSSFTSHNVEKPFKDEPLWLFEHPKRLAQFNGQVSLQGPLNLIHGPNRITSHWWSKLQSRDYFIARQRNGRLLWVFYDRGQREWFLQGLFS